MGMVTTRAVTGEHGGDVVVALVVGPPHPGPISKSPGGGGLDGQGHHEVRLVEMPLQPVALAHHGQIEGPERVGVPVAGPRSNTAAMSDVIGAHS